MRMKNVAGALLVSLCVAAAWQGLASPVVGQPGSKAISQPTNSLVVTRIGTGQAGKERLVVVDTVSQTMAVYHIGEAKGEIRLESVRNIRWDLQVQEFNSASPTPEEIRAGLKQ